MMKFLNHLNHLRQLRDNILNFLRDFLIQNTPFKADIGAKLAYLDTQTESPQVGELMPTLVIYSDSRAPAELLAGNTKKDNTHHWFYFAITYLSANSSLSFPCSDLIGALEVPHIYSHQFTGNCWINTNFFILHPAHLQINELKDAVIETISRLCFEAQVGNSSNVGDPNVSTQKDTNMKNKRKINSMTLPESVTNTTSSPTLNSDNSSQFSKNVMPTKHTQDIEKIRPIDLMKKLKDGIIGFSNRNSLVNVTMEVSVKHEYHPLAIDNLHVMPTLIIYSDSRSPEEQITGSRDHWFYLAFIHQGVNSLSNFSLSDRIGALGVTYVQSTHFTGNRFTGNYWLNSNFGLSKSYSLSLQQKTEILKKAAVATIIILSTEAKFKNNSPNVTNQNLSNKKHATEKAKEKVDFIALQKPVTNTILLSSSNSSQFFKKVVLTEPTKEPQTDNSLLRMLENEQNKLFKLYIEAIEKNDKLILRPPKI
ncbi:MAG: hypothetical protein WBE18_01600 [Gammaproteobacteria bacterium]